MILLSMLAHASSSDGDALVLLVLAIPAFIICYYAVWINLSREYEPGNAPGEWEATEEEEEE